MKFFCEKYLLQAACAIASRAAASKSPIPALEGLQLWAGDKLLVEGYDTMATMHANHNFPYYQKHLEAMGFEKDNDWVQQLVTVPEGVPEKFAKITSMIGRRYNLHAVKLTKKELMKQGYGEMFFHVLNKCYEDLYEFSELNEKQIKKIKTGDVITMKAGCKHTVVATKELKMIDE